MKLGAEISLTESLFSPTEKANSCIIAMCFYGSKTIEQTNKQNR